MPRWSLLRPALAGEIEYLPVFIGRCMSLYVIACNCMPLHVTVSFYAIVSHLLKTVHFISTLTDSVI